MEEHTKVWGKEIWIVNEGYCCKELILNKGYRCSMHYHKKKDEVFYVAKGSVLMEIDEDAIIGNPGDWFRIKPFTRHRFTGLSDSVIVESSSHHEDNDSYRLIKSGKVETNEDETSC